MTKITALVSAYYAEQYLAGRIQNLWACEPNLFDLEILVVCQENSPEAKIAQGMTKVILTPDIPTVYAAWNICLKYATGEYITNANCDDRLYPGALAQLAQALDTHPRAAVAYGNVNEVEALDGETVGVYEWLEGGLTELLTGCFLGPMPLWRKSLHDKYGLFDPTYHSAGDYEFWLRIAAQGEQFHKVDGFTGAYLKRSDSAAHRTPVLSAWETARARSKYRDLTNLTGRNHRFAKVRPGQITSRDGNQPARIRV